MKSRQPPAWTFLGQEPWTRCRRTSCAFVPVLGDTPAHALLLLWSAFQPCGQTYAPWVAGCSISG